MIRVLFICHGISIHALFAEGDDARPVCLPYIRDFYPRPLRRGRLVSYHHHLCACKFLSTPSSQRATSGLAPRVSITSFLSTPSSQRATTEPRIRDGAVQFLSTPSSQRATGVVRYHATPEIFLSTPSSQRATRSWRKLYMDYKKFLSTPSSQRAT